MFSYTLKVSGLTSSVSWSLSLTMFWDSVHHISFVAAPAPPRIIQLSYKIHVILRCVIYFKGWDIGWCVLLVHIFRTASNLTMNKDFQLLWLYLICDIMLLLHSCYYKIWLALIGHRMQRFQLDRREVHDCRNGTIVCSSLGGSKKCKII